MHGGSIALHRWCGNRKEYKPRSLNDASPIPHYIIATMEAPIYLDQSRLQRDTGSLSRKGGPVPAVDKERYEGFGVPHTTRAPPADGENTLNSFACRARL